MVSSHYLLLFDIVCAMAHVLALSEAKKHLGAVIDRARTTHEPVFLSKHGRPVAVLVDAAEFERLRDLAEDAEDAAAAIAARREMEETGALPIPWEEAKAELGLS